MRFIDVVKEAEKRHFDCYRKFGIYLVLCDWERDSIFMVADTPEGYQEAIDRMAYERPILPEGLETL